MHRLLCIETVDNGKNVGRVNQQVNYDDYVIDICVKHIDTTHVYYASYIRIS